MGWRPLIGTSSPKLPTFDNRSHYFVLLYGGKGGGGAMVEKVDLQFSTWDLKSQNGQVGLHNFSTGGRGGGREIVDKVNLEASRCDLKLQKLPILDIRIDFFVSILLPFYRGRGGEVKKVNLKSSRYALKPKIGQLGFEALFYIFLHFSRGVGGGEGGGMVEEVDVEAFRCDLIPQHG